MRLWFKKATIPESNETKEVERVQLWYVRWVALEAILSTIYDEVETLEAFTSEEEAEAFAESLRQANTLLKHHPRHKIIVTKN